MKTFLQSDIDDEQFKLINTQHFARSCDNEQSVYFLLLIAADRGEL